MEDQVRFNFNLDTDKHRKFKSVCSLHGKNMKEVVTDLIDVFIEATEKKDEH